MIFVCVAEKCQVLSVVSIESSSQILSDMQWTLIVGATLVNLSSYKALN